MKFIESRAFTKTVGKYFPEEEYTRFRQFLLENPESGKIITGTGGFRKIRWIDSRRNKGKRGGIRIIYYYFISNKEILLFTIYNKNEANDLTYRVKKLMKQFIKEDINNEKT